MVLWAEVKNHGVIIINHTTKQTHSLRIYFFLGLRIKVVVCAVMRLCFF